MIIISQNITKAASIYSMIYIALGVGLGLGFGGFLVWLVRKLRRDSRKRDIECAISLREATAAEYERKEIQEDSDVNSKYFRSSPLQFGQPGTVYYYIKIEDSDWLFHPSSSGPGKKSRLIEISDQEKQFTILPQIEEEIRYSFNYTVTTRQGGYLVTQSGTSTKSKKRNALSLGQRKVHIDDMKRVTLRIKKYFDEQVPYENKHYLLYFGKLDFTPQFWTDHKGDLYHCYRLKFLVSHPKWQQPAEVTSLTLTVSFPYRMYRTLPIRKQIQSQGRVALSVSTHDKLAPGTEDNEGRAYKFQQKMGEVIVKVSPLRQSMKITCQLAKKYQSYFGFGQKSNFPSTFAKLQIYTDQLREIKQYDLKFMRHEGYILQEKCSGGKVWLKGEQLMLKVKVRPTGLKNWLLSPLISEKFDVPISIQQTGLKEESKLSEETVMVDKAE